MLGNAKSKELEKRGLAFVRYADDIAIFASSQRSAERILESVVKWSSASGNGGIIARGDGKHYIDGGFSFKGFIPRRNRDVAGVAVAHSAISKDFTNAQVLQGNPGFSSETVLEATYNYSISPGWTIQPDFQYIWKPSGENGSQDAAVFGVRTVISF